MERRYRRVSGIKTCQISELRLARLCYITLVGDEGMEQLKTPTGCVSPGNK
jgi:hypothetical protein